MTTKNRQNERKLITDVASEKFKLVVEDTKNIKFNYLHRHLQFVSNSFQNENENTSKKSLFQKYNRGSIVMVNFGINIGYELSGNHFAIILTKDDNKYNGVVTVVPLTSKTKIYI